MIYNITCEVPCHNCYLYRGSPLISSSFLNNTHLNYWFDIALHIPITLRSCTMHRFWHVVYNGIRSKHYLLSLSSCILAFEKRCYSRMLQVHHSTHALNVIIAEHVGKNDTLLDIVEKRKVRWLGESWGERRELWQTSSCRVMFRGEITRKESKTGLTCKGMDMAELNWAVGWDRGPWGLEKTCQSCCPKWTA